MTTDLYHAGRAPGSVTECEMVTPRHISRRGSGIVPKPFAGFGVAESCALYEVLQSLTEQVVAYSNQPRFEDKAGDFLEELSESFSRQMRELATHLKAVKPSDEAEREIRAKALIIDAMLDTDSIAELAAVVASLAVAERH